MKIQETIPHRVTSHFVPWCLLLVGACGFNGLASGQEAPAAKFAPFDFQGRFLVAVSDADMLPSALPPPERWPLPACSSLSDRLRLILGRGLNDSVGLPRGRARTPTGSPTCCSAKLVLPVEPILADG